jgi:hypothetical protein
MVVINYIIIGSYNMTLDLKSSALCAEYIKGLAKGIPPYQKICALEWKCPPITLYKMAEISNAFSGLCYRLIYLIINILPALFVLSQRGGRGGNKKSQ